MNTNFPQRANLKTSMLCLALLSFAAHSAEIEGKICTVRCVVPHKIAPKPILNKALWLCFQMQPLIIVLAAPSMALNLDLPPDVSLTPDPEKVPPTLADIPVIEGGGYVESVSNAVVGVVSTGGGYVMPSPPAPLGAPEIDPGAGLSAVLLLGGVLCVLTGRRRVK
jgi:hypothetical protein